MKLYGLIGKPLTHSFSKTFFTKKIAAEDIQNCRYENFELQAIEQLSVLLEGNKELCGLNVTIPYKEKVIPYLNFKNEIVAETGACNCIKIRNNQLFGYNTDVTGFKQALQPFLKPHYTKALILGTGGAAKAVAYSLQSMGIDYLFVSRRKVENGLTYDALNEDTVVKHTLIINTTPLGMYPDVNTFPSIPYQFITAQHLLFDLTYNPGKTIFLQKGEKKGASIANGYTMLVLQAEESWKIWNE